MGIYQFEKNNTVTFLANYAGANPQKAVCLMHKSSLDPENHEVDRFVRLDNKGNLEYMSFRLQNRTGAF